MSSHDNEELIDYEDEHDVVANGATASTTNGAAAAAAAGEGDKDKKNFSGIHSTGFRYVQWVGISFRATALIVKFFIGTSC
jgi:ATP-dependent RNA helicase UAP56/SUB2